MRMKIGTFNIQHGAYYPYYLEHGTEKIDLTKISDTVKKLGLDICGLNEVRNQENIPGMCNQAKVIAEALTYEYHFARAIDNRGGDYGNALISRFPILSVRDIPISLPADRRPERRYEDRVLIKADILAGGKPITVMACHIGLSAAEAQLAVDIIRKEAETGTNPTVLMGDFNFSPDSDFYRQLCLTFTDTASLLPGEGLSFPSDRPDIKIDYLFTKGACRAVEAEIPELVVSDHRPYAVTLEF